MRIYRPIAILLLVSQAGCYTTRTLQSPTELAGARMGRLWVTTNNGTEVVIASARILDDTIFGFNAAGQQTVMPFSDAKTVKVRELSTGKTALLGAAVLAGIIAAAILLKGKGNQKGGGGTTTDCDKHPDAIECMV